MKKYLMLGIACFFAFFLVSCANRGYHNVPEANPDMTQEHWMQRINLNPNLWLRQADRWFYTDEPSRFDEYAPDAPASSAITAMNVRVNDFTNIVVAGAFRIQIYGGQDRNSVYILGPNAEARQVVTEIQGNTLYIHQARDCAKSCTSTSQVIVRIGIRDLQNLSSSGGSPIEGKNIYSSRLNITDMSNASILMAGNMNVANIGHSGAGALTLIGVNSPSLNVKVIGNGTVNLNGRINIHHIIKRGCGNINIIGADSDSLDIQSAGSGTTAIAGYATLKRLNAIQNSRVYLYWVSSNGIYANVHDNSRVGLAGTVRNLDVEVDGASRFEGKYLRADNIYITTRNKSHANVFPVQRLFATALDNSSIYIFGAPNVVSRYTMGNGVIIPVWCDTCPVVPLPPPSAMRWDNAPAPVQHHTTYKGERQRYK